MTENDIIQRLQGSSTPLAVSILNPNASSFVGAILDRLLENGIIFKTPYPVHYGLTGKHSSPAPAKRAVVKKMVRWHKKPSRVQLLKPITTPGFSRLRRKQRAILNLLSNTDGQEVALERLTIVFGKTTGKHIEELASRGWIAKT